MFTKIFLSFNSLQTTLSLQNYQNTHVVQKLQLQTGVFLWLSVLSKSCHYIMNQKVNIDEILKIKINSKKLLKYR